MNLTNRELKIIIYDFHRKSNRLLQTHNEEFTDNISKLISYIDSQPVIKEFVDSCGICNMNVDEEFQQVFNSYDRAYFLLGSTDEEETKNAYTILKEMASRNIGYYSLRNSGYGTGSNQYSDKIKDFNERVSCVLIYQISAYLTKLGINRGIDERIETNIVAGDGSQINFANNGSTVNATFTTYNADFEEALNCLQKEINMLEKDKAEATQYVDVIREEVGKEKPRKAMISTAVQGLKMIKGTFEFGAAVSTIVQLLNTMEIL